VLQYLSGALRKPGVTLMGHAVEPERLIADMQRMGIAVEESRPRKKIAADIA
jgi:hypothetical protein